MAIVGFSFTKFDAARKSQTKGRINIANNVTVKDVAHTDLFLGTNKQDGLRFDFVFTSAYDPDVGHITLEGNVLYLDDAKKIKDVLGGWKKSKTVPTDVTEEVLNQVLGKCNIQALILSKDLNMPPPIPLPKVNVDTGRKVAKGS